MHRQNALSFPFYRGANIILPLLFKHPITTQNMVHKTYKTSTAGKRLLDKASHGDRRAEERM